MSSDLSKKRGSGFEAMICTRILYKVARVRQEGKGYSNW
jgi:hypothetical protein